jgi:F0F1-type ATP synthase assembly protein I
VIRPGAGDPRAQWYGSAATKRSGETQGRPLDDAAWYIVSTLLAGMVLYGGLGWVVSLWLGHRALFIAGGVLVGLFLSFYLVQKRLASEAGPGSPRAGRS